MEKSFGPVEKNPIILNNEETDWFKFEQTVIHDLTVMAIVENASLIINNVTLKFKKKSTLTYKNDKDDIPILVYDDNDIIKCF